jgi:hypothetical protein
MVCAISPKNSFVKGHGLKSVDGFSIASGTGGSICRPALCLLGLSDTNSTEIDRLRRVGEPGVMGTDGLSITVSPMTESSVVVCIWVDVFERDGGEKAFHRIWAS